MSFNDLSKPPRGMTKDAASIRWLNDLWLKVTETPSSTATGEGGQTIVNQGQSFDQSLNTTDDVKFNSIELNGRDAFRYLFFAGS